MNRVNTQQQSASGLAASSTAKTRLSGSRLIIARAVWLALVTAFFLLMFIITYPGFSISALAFAYPALTVPITFMSALGLASLALFLVLFPNGRLVPRWMGLFLLLAMIGTVSTALPPT